jgi:hypothetical protein
VRSLLFALPCGPEEPRGNVTTAQRLARGLKEHGWLAARCDARTDARHWPSADAVVAMHAVHAAPRVRAACDAATGAPALRGRPWLVLFTGTDLVATPPEEARAAVAECAAAVALGEAAALAAAVAYPEPRGGLHVIRQGLEPLPSGAELPEGLPVLAPDDELLLLPCGVRAVKDPARAVRALAPLAAARPRLRLWIAGPEMESAYAAELREAILRANVQRAEPWARWLGAVPRARLRPLVERAAIVLSTSRSEGGAPNALLEAADAGALTLASDVPAHREFPGAAFCFGSDEELRELVNRFLDHPETARYAAAAQRVVLGRNFRAADEAAAWDALLRRALAPA